MQHSIAANKTHSKPIRIAPIRLRLAVGFFTVLLAMSFMTYRYLQESGKIETHLENINSVNSVKQRYAINFRGSVHDRAISLRDVVLAENLQEARIYIKEINDLAQKYAESAGPLDKLLAEGHRDDQEHSILNDIKKIEAHTLPLIDRVIYLRMSGADDEAHELLMKKAKPAFSQWLKDINRFIDLEEAKNKAEGEAIRTILVNAANMGLLTLLIAALVSIGAAVWIIFALKPLRHLSAVMQRMASGDFSPEIPNFTSRDELGLIARTTMVFRDNGLEMQRMQHQQEQLKQKAEEEKRQAAAKLADDFEHSVKGIVSAVTNAVNSLYQSTQNMAQTVGTSKTLTENATGTANDTSENVQSAAAASDQLSATVNEISSQLQKTSQLVLDSLEKARNADGLANALNDATTKVSNAMEMISGIAGQINLLSLNATIESARAGEAGRGFAVVASEVKNLANQTNKTTEDIQYVVCEMSQAAQAIITALSEIGDSVSSISEATSSVASAVEEQSATTNEIAKNMQSAAARTRSIATDLTDVQSASSQAETASNQILASARELTQRADDLNQQVDGFLVRVRV